LASRRPRIVSAAPCACKQGKATSQPRRRPIVNKLDRLGRRPGGPPQAASDGGAAGPGGGDAPAAAHAAEPLHRRRPAVGLRRLLAHPAPELPAPQVRELISSQFSLRSLSANAHSNRDRVSSLNNNLCLIRWDLPGAAYDRTRGNRRNWYALLTAHTARSHIPSSFLCGSVHVFGGVPCECPRCVLARLA
jgi:hypothetical protein